MTRTSLREDRRTFGVLVFAAIALAGGLLLLVAVSPWSGSPAEAAPRFASAKAPWPASLTPVGTSNLVVVLGRTEDDAGRIWIRASLAILPNNTTGWVPRDGLGGYTNVRTRLVIDVEALTATLLREGPPIFRAYLGVGTPQWPTPRGEFFIRNRLTAY